MAHALVLTVHIVAGTTGLVLGPFALKAALRRRPPTGPAGVYQAAVGVLTVTAIGLAVMDWRRLWPFAFIAVATGAAVVAGRSVRERAFPGAAGWHVRLIGGSYISLVTALLVVSWGSVVAWILPTVVGATLVERAAARAEGDGESGAHLRSAPGRMARSTAAQSVLEKG